MVHAALSIHRKIVSSWNRCSMVLLCRHEQSFRVRTRKKALVDCAGFNYDYFVRADCAVIVDVEKEVERSVIEEGFSVYGDVEQVIRARLFHGVRFIVVFTNYVRRCSLRRGSISTIEDKFFESFVSSMKFCFIFVPNVLDSRSFSDIADLP